MTSLLNQEIALFNNHYSGNEIKLNSKKMVCSKDISYAKCIHSNNIKILSYYIDNKLHGKRKFFFCENCLKWLSGMQMNLKGTINKKML